MTKTSFTMAPDAVYLVPLGGCGMFGGNMTLYGYRGKWIMVDCGMAFADDTMPGVDVLLPDPSFAENLGEDLLGIVLTHGHEDHIGALQYLWPRLKKPVYATPLTLMRVGQAVSEQSWGHQARLNAVPTGGQVTLGDFSIRFVDMCHSIPESSALAITVGDVGTLLHTGDWKMDDAPIEGAKTDEAALKKLGDNGLLAVVGDSTNAMVPGKAGSERDVKESLIELFGEFDSRIAVTCFSTSVARLSSIDAAAKANGRQVCLVGRSLWKMDKAARECGYLKGVRPFIDDQEADSLRDDEVVYICTGSQGEPRAALTRIAANEHRGVALGAGDVVIFSSRAIPGNDRAIERIKNRLHVSGVIVISDSDAPVHVSGHPCRDELKSLYALTRPKLSIPVHGERVQLEKHAQLARECGVNQALVPANGDVIEIKANDLAAAVATVKTGMLAVEGGRVVASDHEAILTRKRIMFNGSAVVTVVIDDQGRLAAPPKITALGLLDESADLDVEILKEAVKAVEQAINNTPKDIRHDDGLMGEAIRVAARRFFNERFDRKPQTRVHLVRI